MKKQLTGVIVSDKMVKTAVVRVDEVKEHAKYKRKYQAWKKYKAHVDEKIAAECREGALVIIEECRPMSKDKKWRIVKVLKTAVNRQTEE